MDYIMSIMPALLMGTWFSIKLSTVFREIVEIKIGLFHALSYIYVFRCKYKDIVCHLLYIPIKCIDRTTQEIKYFS